MLEFRWQDIVRGAIAPLCLTASMAQAAGPLPFTEEWYRLRADDPPGARQIEKDGKLWPPYPRPVGRKQTLKHAYHTAHYWPYPYNCDDRAYVNNLLDQQAASGWVTATTLHDYYFNPETHQLNDAGQNYLAWIVVSAPPQHRTVYVSQGPSIETGQLRAKEVEQHLQRTGVEQMPPVLVRQEFFAGRPANEVDALRKLELNSIPRPRLFTIGNGSGGRSGAGQGGSQGSGGGAGGAGGGSGTSR